MKRQKTPKSWPVRRKGTAYVVRANFNLKQGIPVLIILRDILKIAKNRKEVKRAIHSGKVLLNHKKIKDEKNSAILFDIISIIPSKKYYRLDLNEKCKFKLEEIKESEIDEKISKVISKKTLKKGKTQINLSDGRNFLSDIKCKINDSVLINLKDKKIEKCLALEKGKSAIVFAGKYSGKKGKINKLNLEEKTAELKVDDSRINVLIKQIMVTE